MTDRYEMVSQPPPLPFQLPNLNIEGYRFYRSDGLPFDTLVNTFVTSDIDDEFTFPPRARVDNTTRADIFDDEEDEEAYYCYHVCSSSSSPPPPTPPSSFALARRCEPAWSGLSEQQRDAIEKIENHVAERRTRGEQFSAAIVEGPGGCGKTRLMAYVMNHPPPNTYVLYTTKQNKRLQDFLYDELERCELIPPAPVNDMTVWNAERFALMIGYDGDGGRYACTVEKMVYNTAGRVCGRETNKRDVLQWKMQIPDDLFSDVNAGGRNAVVLLDEYTMIAPPLLHKLLHCVQTMFGVPTVLLMGGDRFQLGPVNWDEASDREYADRCGAAAPPDSVTRNNRFYSSDVRKELASRLLKDEAPFEYAMSGSQRCRDDQSLVDTVKYLRNACRVRTSVKAIERKLVRFGRKHNIPLYRRVDAGTGRLMFAGDDDVESGDYGEDSDEDRHLGDDDPHDAPDDDYDNGVMAIDRSAPPSLDMTPFIDFYGDLYEQLYARFDGVVYGDGDNTDTRTLVYDRAARFARRSFPIFLVKKNDRCNILSDTFLKALYNGIYTRFVGSGENVEDDDDDDDDNDYENDFERDTRSDAKRPRTEANENTAAAMAAADDRRKRRKRRKRFLESLCVSLQVSTGVPVQQTLMVGAPYRMTDTLKSPGTGTPVLCNGETVLLTAIRMNGDKTVKDVAVRPLHRGRIDRYTFVTPGVTRNRLNDSDTANGRHLMLPMVPLVCENIYQMQGNTIQSDCFVDLASARPDDIYVAVSRFRNTKSIRGIILSK